MASFNATRDSRRAEGASLSEALQSFAAGIAHEARNQIFALTATLDAFEARFSNETQAPPHFAVMRDELQRLTALMHGLAELGHPTAPVLAFGHVRDALRDALSAARPSAERKQLELSAHLDDPRATAWFDRGRLSLALGYLLEHAIRRSPDGGTLELSITRGEGEDALITVAIEDRGPALVAEHLERIFEPFFLPNRAGRGLELALAERIVEQHGGSARALNRSGPSGLCLSVLIPGSSES